MRRTALPSLLLLSACAPASGELSAIDRVWSAWIAGAELSTAAVVGGVIRGSGELFVESEDGTLYSTPVDLRGGTIGAAVDLLAVSDPAGEVELWLPDHPVTGDDLLGTYRGHSESLVIVAGVEVHHLKNSAGVEIDEPFVALGLGLMVGFEWLRVVPPELP